MSSDGMYALSVKQPWATLILEGLKSIEIRSWPTARRGSIYVHAARISDARSHGWDLVPEHARETAQLAGGLIGTVDITECITYRTREEFARDHELHRNDPDWFDGKQLYGFRFANPVLVPFRPLAGWFRFFPIDRAPTPKTSKRTSRQD